MPEIIALTGATGFIGGALAHRLHAENWQIRALARPASKRNPLSDINVEWIEGDLDDADSLRRLVKNVYAVVHCAGAVRGASSDHFFHVNTHGVANLVEAAIKEHPAPRFLLISSLAAREPHLSYYAASKKKGEEALAQGAGGMPWAALRPPPVYGPGDKEMLPLFRLMLQGIAPVIGDPGARFSMLYVQDLTDAIVQWLKCGSTLPGPFELHDGQENGYSWDDLIRVFSGLRGRQVYRVRIPILPLAWLARINVWAARLAGYAPMLTPGKICEIKHPDWTCDNTLFSQETGWTPQIFLEEGLRRTLKPDIGYPKYENK
ncbi:MAG: NAD(P)-dependent oxidoreductase [Desulfosalsimonadaceae bacterium]